MPAIEHEITDDEYREYLDEIYGEVDICGLKYSAGYALQQLDEVAFRCGQSDMMQWECSFCGKVFDEESDAEECDCEKPEEFERDLND